ncbi:MAG: glycosyltransferase family 2 protein [Coriobacteriia bacterium]
MRVVALIPAHNEELCVGRTVRAASGIPAVSRVVVVDDGSSDDTSSMARDAGAEVIRLERNAGKGGALNAGLHHVRDDADVVLLLDADLGETAASGAALLGPVLSGDADMTVGVLPKPPGSGGFGLVKGVARLGIRSLGGGFETSAPISGQRALNRAAWQAATPFAAGYGAEVALTVRALRAGLRVLEVPVRMTHAATGKDLAGFVHRGRQFAHIVTTLARLATRG